MSKMGLHEPFGHIQHKLWQKERPGVKLPIWLPTSKSQESTRLRCVQVKCDTPLESYQREIQVCFRPHPNWRFDQRVMTPQSGGNPNLDSFGTPPWESWDKKPFGCGPVESYKVYYMGEGGGFPRIWAVVSLVNLKSPMACPSTKGALESELTNLLVDWMHIRMSN
jgi:hypothetical protein